MWLDQEPDVRREGRIGIYGTDKFRPCDTVLHRESKQVNYFLSAVADQVGAEDFAAVILDQHFGEGNGFSIGLGRPPGALSRKHTLASKNGNQL